MRTLMPMIAGLACLWQLGAADFRDSEWGDSKSDVRGVETLPFHHDYENELAYFSDEIPGISGGVKYYFEDEKLIEGVYLSRNLHSDASGYYSDYITIRNHFDEQLGDHISEEWDWSGKVHEEDAAAVARSIMNGKLKITTHWAYGGTKASCTIEPRKGRISVRVFFRPNS